MLPFYDQLTNFNNQKTWTVGIFEKVTSLHKQQRKLDNDPTHIFTRIVRGRCKPSGSLILVSTNGRLHVMKLYRITNNKPHKGLSKIPDCPKGRGWPQLLTSRPPAARLPCLKKNQKKPNLFTLNAIGWLSCIINDNTGTNSHTWGARFYRGNWLHLHLGGMACRVVSLPRGMSQQRAWRLW